MTGPRSSRKMPTSFSVVHEDAHLLVVHKAPGVATTAPDDGPCLTQDVRAYDQDAPRLHASSRLDLPVSGLVTFARTSKAITALRQAREDGAYARLYLALTTAPIEEESEGDWRWSLGIARRDKRLREVGSPKDAKEAHTRFRVRAAGAISLLELRPQTGRTHQLRVHASHAGWPLLGDHAYGGEKRVALANGRVVTARRVMLHCAALAIPDVARGGTLELELPPPEDFCRAYSALGGDVDLLTPGPAADRPTTRS